MTEELEENLGNEFWWMKKLWKNFEREKKKQTTGIYFRKNNLWNYFQKWSKTTKITIALIELNHLIRLLSDRSWRKKNSTIKFKSKGRIFEANINQSMKDSSRWLINQIKFTDVTEIQTLSLFFPLQNNRIIIIIAKIIW